MKNQLPVAALVPLLFIAIPLQAQSNTSQAAELAAIRAQIETLRAESEKSIQALQRQLDEMQARQQLTPTPPAAPPASQAVTGGSVSSAKVFNPDISVVGDFIGTAGHNEVNPSPAMEMHETEVAFQAVVDPYARADFYISFGEEGVALEEGYITFPALPGSIQLKVGKMRAAFGKVNTLHNHVLPWSDRPLVTQSLVGGEDGIDDAGFSVSRLIPNKFMFLEGTAQVFRGDSGDNLFKSSEPSDLSYVGHLRAYKDITDDTNLDLGFSFSYGHNASGIVGGADTGGFATKLWSGDATIRWKPLQRSVYHSFVGRSEFVLSQRDQPGGSQSATGFFASADYQLARRWYTGFRYDRTGHADNASLVDSGQSVTLSYFPSEFSQIRTQYRRTQYGEAATANEVRFQIPVFNWGARRPPVLTEEEIMKVKSIAGVIAILSVWVVMVPPLLAQAKLNVVATTQDLASIASEVGGDHISVDSIAKGYQDPHFVEAKPSFLVKLSKADLLILVGRELEIGWLPPLINQSGNSKIQMGTDGYLDASLQAQILDVPNGQVTRADGDVHPLGNPHYWMDPENGKIIAKEIFDRLVKLRPNDRSYFEPRLKDFNTRLDAAEKRWLTMMAPYKGTKVVTYHRSFPNFAERFGLNVVGYVEPKPGIPPTPQHNLELVNQMKKDNVKIILVEPYFDAKTPNKIGSDTGAEVLIMPPSVGGTKEVTDYIKLFDNNLNMLVAAIKKTTGK